jgi:hypothetical protein
VRDDRPLIRTRDDLLELIAHALRLQLSYLSKDQALAVADTILRTLKAARLSPVEQRQVGSRVGGVRPRPARQIVAVEQIAELAAVWAAAGRIGQPPIRARELLRLHRQTYYEFWRWSDAAVDHAMLTGGLHTVFGWRVQVPAQANDRSLRNFPMQANGAEMLRLACCLATERGIEACADP